MERCPYCSFENYDGSSYCGNCGENILEHYDKHKARIGQAQRVAVREKQNAGIKLIGCFFALGVIAMIGMAVFVTSTKDIESASEQEPYRTESVAKQGEGASVMEYTRSNNCNLYTVPGDYSRRYTKMHFSINDPYQLVLKGREGQYAFRLKDGHPMLQAKPFYTKIDNDYKFMTSTPEGEEVVLDYDNKTSKLHFGKLTIQADTNFYATPLALAASKDKLFVLAGSTLYRMSVNEKSTIEASMRISAMKSLIKTGKPRFGLIDKIFYDPFNEKIWIGDGTNFMAIKSNFAADTFSLHKFSLKGNVKAIIFSGNHWWIYYTNRLFRLDEGRSIEELMTQ